MFSAELLKVLLDCDWAFISTFPSNNLFHHHCGGIFEKHQLNDCDGHSQPDGYQRISPTDLRRRGLRELVQPGE
jgi:hypothetical protein